MTPQLHTALSEASNFALTESEVGESVQQAHVLFFDVVGFSLLPLADQKRTMQILQEIVRQCADYQRADAEQQLVRLPAGDGMALVFLRDAEAPLRCAIEITQRLKAFPAIQLRMGAHTGSVMLSADINANRNAVGSGINLAHRVMSCGDAGHILVSRCMVETLKQQPNWQAMLQPLGECVVKHQIRVQLYNLSTGEIGNDEIPAKLIQKQPRQFKRMQTVAKLAGYVSATLRVAHCIYPMLTF